MAPGLFLWFVRIRHNVLCQTGDKNGPFRFLAVRTYRPVRSCSSRTSLLELAPARAVSTIDQSALESTQFRSGCRIRQKSLVWEYNLLHGGLKQRRTGRICSWQIQCSSVGTVRCGSTPVAQDNTFSGRECEPSFYERLLTCIFISIGSLFFGAYMNACTGGKVTPQHHLHHLLNQSLKPKNLRSECPTSILEEWWDSLKESYIRSISPFLV